MPTDTRLLYILADLAYITKLVPSKKAHEFVLSDFRQINGEFLDENTLIQKNLAKLFSKLEAGSYKLILPDFLFTSTIVNIELDNEEAVKEHLKSKLLPELGINDADFYLDTTVLSNYKGSFKVQLTALEKSVVAPLTEALKDHKDVKIDGISPLSWTTKSIISLEPSVAILQMGNHLFLAEHYIGVDQCYSVDVAEAENFTETVKTLKGVESSLQTVYLLTNSLVDDAIKDKLKETLPVQQLADLASEGGNMPSYVRQIIEAGAKTYSIPEFLLPQFTLDKDYEVKADKKDNNETEDLSNLVKPAVVGEAVLPAPLEVKAEEIAASVESLDEEDEEEAEDKVEEIKEVKETKKADDVELEEVKAWPDFPTAKVEAKQEVKMPELEKEKDIDFSQFANLALDPSVFSKNKSVANSQLAKDGKGEMKITDLPEKTVIKNHNDGASVSKMILIGLLSFVITIALGAGLAFTYVKWTATSSNTKPVVEVQPSVTPVATTTPTLTPEIVKADYTILVVNATTKAGYAGTIVAKVKEGGFDNVSAKNAKGIYEPGDYLLVQEDNAINQALLKELEKATSLTLTLKADIATEDSSSKSSAVIVLGQ